MTPLRAGSAFALTVMCFYSLCTLLAVALPQQFLGFMLALFHGLDFGALASTQPYTWSMFLYALLILGLWAFAAGACFAWLLRLLSGAQRHG
jgi:hypothetical protein